MKKSAVDTILEEVLLQDPAAKFLIDSAATMRSFEEAQLNLKWVRGKVQGLYQLYGNPPRNAQVNMDEGTAELAEAIGFLFVSRDDFGPKGASRAIDGHAIAQKQREHTEIARPYAEAIVAKIKERIANRKNAGPGF